MPGINGLKDSSQVKSVCLSSSVKCLFAGLKEKKEWRPVGFRAPWLAHSDALYEAIQESDQIVYDSSLPSFQQPFRYNLQDPISQGVSFKDLAISPGRWGSRWLRGQHPECQLSKGWHLQRYLGVSNQSAHLRRRRDRRIRSTRYLFFFPSLFKQSDLVGTPFEIWQLLKNHLAISYEGNRAPMMLSLHSSQFFSMDPDQKQQVYCQRLISSPHLVNLPGAQEFLLVG